VIFDAAFRVRHDALEDLEQVEHFDFEPGLFANFAAGSLFEALAGFDAASGQRPVTSERRVAALYQKDAPVLDDQRADAQNGTRGIAPRIVLR
jgi:hypothetical protein